MAKAATLGTPGPQPKTFKTWCLSVGRKGCRKFRVRVEGQKEPSMVAFSTGAASARTIEKMGAVWCEALDDDGSIIRIWQFKERDEVEEQPGYIKEADDTNEERLLKTLAHLVADAYRAGNKQLVEVIQIQGNAFSEERKQLTTLRLMNDKLLASLARKTGRLRVATDEEGEGQEEEEDNTFLQDLLQPVLANMTQKAARKAGAEVAAQVLGEEPKTPNGAAKE
jgi:hypothetical protein